MRQGATRSIATAPALETVPVTRSPGSSQSVIAHLPCATRRCHVRSGTSLIGSLDMSTSGIASNVVSPTFTRLSLRVQRRNHASARGEGA